MGKVILHITDLHLNNFEGSDEHLRKGFFQEYLESFADALKKNHPKIDFALFTGDFVDIGKVENLIHVDEIITFLAKKIGLTKKQIGVCIGNHDYKYKDENGSNSQQVRKPFHDFSRVYANGKAIFSNERFSLNKIKSDLFYLAIDSTLDTGLAKNYKALLARIAVNKKDDSRRRPGNMAEAEIDNIITIIRSKLKDTDVLLIGCHYPVEKFLGSSMYGEEDNFDDNHVWDKASQLRIRINKIKTKATCWFFGDTHLPDTIQIDHICYCMTGRFGTSTSKPSQIRRQGRVVEISDIGPNSVTTIQNESLTHQDSPSDANWKSEKSSIRTVVRSVLNNLEKSPNPTPPLVNNFIDLIDSETEDEIVNKIVKENLYSFGRFRTTHNNTSLGWVSINPLLNSGKILTTIVDKSKKRIESLQINSPSTSIIIGLDFWGAIMATQVAVGTGISSYCIATRGSGQYASAFEVNHDILTSRLTALKDVILFIDVVSCGETINTVIENIKKLKSSIKFHAISVIIGGGEYNVDYAKKIKSFGTFCRKLKIPIVKDDDLPSSEILPYTIDFGFKPKSLLQLDLSSHLKQKTKLIKKTKPKKVIRKKV
jgi:predicted MPP superfamily phosphohydrolase